MSILRSLMSLRRLLIIDAATCTVTGAALAFGSVPVAGLTDIPPALLFYAGLSLFPVAAFMAIVATRPFVSPTGIWLVAAGNGFWAAASMLLLVTDWIAPNALGIAFIAAQALVAAVFGWLESIALRDTRLAVPAG